MNNQKQPMSLSEELQWREFVNQTTYTKIEDVNKPTTFYFGVDPSASSMTIGNLAAVMMVRKFIQHGHKAILLIGGATGLIGDPDGKKDERKIRTREEVNSDKARIVSEYKKLFGDLDFEVVDNHDWFKDINYIDFLSQIGKNVPMRQMLGREFIQSRLGEDGSGISYAEFSYVLIQAYDFLHLNREKGVSLQLSGSDQWGNSIAGVDLIRRLDSKTAHVWTTPLVVNKATGVKFGKSEEGAVWLNPELTSPYRFYQFWLNVDDEGVEYYLKIYTELPKHFIDDVMRRFNEDRSIRLAQKTLAYEVTELVHGKDTAESVVRVSKVLFGGESYDKLTKDDFIILKAELPTIKAKLDSSLIDLLTKAKLASSKGEARRFLESKAVYINGQQVEAGKLELAKSDAIAGHVVLRRGKNASAIVELS